MISSFPRLNESKIRSQTISYLSWTVCWVCYIRPGPNNCSLNLYTKKPQIARTRAYFDKSVYYYHYEGKTWVISKPFITTKNEKNMSNKEVAKFKIDCSRIARRLFLNQRAAYLEYHIAEIIWRLNNPNPDALVDYIYNVPEFWLRQYPF